MEDFNYRIGVELLRLQKTVVWLSSDSGVPRATISGWKSKGRMPNADQLHSIAKSLGTTVEYLLTGQEAESLDLGALSKTKRDWVQFIVNKTDEEVSQLNRVIEAAQALRKGP